jgi:hypothetical protein
MKKQNQKHIANEMAIADDTATTNTTAEVVETAVVETTTPAYTAMLNGKQGAWDCVVEHTADGKRRMLSIGGVLLRNGKGTAVDRNGSFDLGQPTITLGGMEYTTNHGDGRFLGRLKIGNAVAFVGNDDGDKPKRRAGVMSNMAQALAKGIADTTEIETHKTHIADLTQQLATANELLEGMYGKLLSRDSNLQSAENLSDEDLLTILSARGLQMAGGKLVKGNK